MCLKDSFLDVSVSFLRQLEDNVPESEFEQPLLTVRLFNHYTTLYRPQMFGPLTVEWVTVTANAMFAYSKGE